jgi:hypothetical protein
MKFLNWIMDAIVVRRMYGSRRERELLFQSYMDRYQIPYAKKEADAVPKNER